MPACWTGYRQPNISVKWVTIGMFRFSQAPVPERAEEGGVAHDFERSLGVSVPSPNDIAADDGGASPTGRSGRGDIGHDPAPIASPEHRPSASRQRADNGAFSSAASGGRGLTAWCGSEVSRVGVGFRLWFEAGAAVERSGGIRGVADLEPLAAARDVRIRLQASRRRNGRRCARTPRCSGCGWR